jgi:inosine/xanthosine triphosphatase
MIVAVGSKNKAKTGAVKSAFSKYFEAVQIRGCSVKSGVGKQPTSLAEIVKGAKGRARRALALEAEAELGVGIEAGIFQFPESHSGYMDTACCAIFDGKEFYLGGSPLFEYPKAIVKKILREKKEVSKIFAELFGESEKRYSEGQGAIGFLSKGIVPRKALLEQAVAMALLRIVNKEAYGSD